MLEAPPAHGARLPLGEVPDGRRVPPAATSRWLTKAGPISPPAVRPGAEKPPRVGPGRNGPGRSLAVLGVLAIVVGLVTAGCGSKKQPTSTADWANGVCSAISTWTTSVKSSANTLKSGNLSKTSLQSAADATKSATETLRSDLNSLGEPGTQAGQQAKSLTDELRANLKSGIDTITTAVNGASGVSGVVSAGATVVTTVATMADQVTSTVSSLKQLGGEVQTAFQQSSECQQISGST